MKLNDKTLGLGLLAIAILCFLGPPVISQLLQKTAKNEKEEVVGRILDGVTSGSQGRELVFTRGRAGFYTFSDAGWLVLVPKILHKDSGSIANWNTPWFIGGKMNDGLIFFVRGGKTREITCMKLLNGVDEEFSDGGVRRRDFIDWITKFCETNKIDMEYFEP